MQALDDYQRQELQAITKKKKKKEGSNTESKNSVAATEGGVVLVSV